MLRWPLILLWLQVFRFALLHSRVLRFRARLALRLNLAELLLRFLAFRFLRLLRFRVRLRLRRFRLLLRRLLRCLLLRLLRHLRLLQLLRRLR